MWSRLTWTHWSDRLEDLEVLARGDLAVNAIFEEQGLRVDSAQVACAHEALVKSCGERVLQYWGLAGEVEGAQEALAKVRLPLGHGLYTCVVALVRLDGFSNSCVCMQPRACSAPSLPKSPLG